MLAMGISNFRHDDCRTIDAEEGWKSIFWIHGPMIVCWNITRLDIQNAFVIPPSERWPIKRLLLAHRIILKYDWWILLDVIRPKQIKLGIHGKQSTRARFECQLIFKTEFTIVGQMFPTAVRSPFRVADSLSSLQIIISSLFDPNLYTGSRCTLYRAYSNKMVRIWHRILRKLVPTKLNPIHNISDTGFLCDDLLLWARV